MTQSTDPACYGKLAATPAIEALIVDLLLRPRGLPKEHRLDSMRPTIRCTGTNEAAFSNCSAICRSMVFRGCHLPATLRRSNIGAPTGTVEEIGLIVRRHGAKPTG